MIDKTEKDNLPTTQKELQTSEIRYRRLFEAARDGILILDAETLKITDVNPYMMEFLGYSLDEFIGSEVWEFGISGDKEKNRAAFKELQKTGYLKYEDMPLETKGGECRDIEFVCNVHQEGQNQVIQCNIRDISGRKKLEERERQSAKNSEIERLRLIEVQEVAKIGSWELDLQTNVLTWSDENYRIFGIDQTEFGASYAAFLDLLPPDDRAAVNKAFTESVANHTPYKIEYRLLMKDGSIKSVQERCRTFYDADGKSIRSVGTTQDITERKRIEESLRQAETKYRNLVELSPAIVYLAQPFPPYSPIYVSPNIEMLGYSQDEWYEKPNLWADLIHEEDRAQILRMTEEARNQNLETDLEYRIVTPDGRVHWLHDKGRFISDEQGNKIGWQGVIVDITETRRLEEQLRQSQKLESVGRLAGGIAHDFNNMLTAISGYSELTLRRMKEDDPLRRNIEEIKKAGDRSAELTHQLLAFSRRQVLKPTLINLNEVIDETGNMLQRLIGEDIQFVSVINPKLGFVMADFGQLTQIILNLTVNARDAMPQGGKLTIETANVFLDPDYTRRHSEVLPGAYVMLAVSDTGIGMDAEIQKHIFEPFFSTKEVGHGTGLGLATVYGIVRQSGGNINIYSEEGIGTTFKIYLPRVMGEAEVKTAEDSDKKSPAATGTILLVEDEAIVRSLTRQILEECGYTIIEARNGLEALEICATGDCKFDLLMTDIVMPQMGGRELADILKEKVPDLQILFTSGYTDDAVVRHGVIEVGTNFIQKPFTPDALADKVRELLDESKQ